MIGKLSRRHQSIFVLFSYTALAFLFVGRLWIFHPFSQVVGVNGDSYIFIFMLKWWLHAIIYQVNPLYVSRIWAPLGSNLMFTTNLPLFSVLMAPVTDFLGPAFSFNILITLAPIASAFVMYLFVRWYLKDGLSAWVAGFIYGFSTFEMVHIYNGHLNLVWTFYLPAIVWLICAKFSSLIKNKKFVALLVLLLLAQFLTSKELFSILTLALFIWAALYCLLNWESRHLVFRMLPWVVVAYLITLFLLSPLLYYAAILPNLRAYHPPVFFSTDFLNYIFPTSYTWLGGQFFLPISQNFISVNSEQTAYLGWPLLFIVYLAIRQKKTKAVLLLLLAMLVFILLSMGPILHISGWSIVFMPWAAISLLPLFKLILPSRYTWLVFFILALIVAHWLSVRQWRPRWQSYLFVVLVVLFLLPAPTSTKGNWYEPYQVLPDKVGLAIPKDSRVLVLSFSARLLGVAAIWNVDHQRFFMTSGDLGPGAISTSNFVAIHTFYPIFLKQRPKGFDKYLRESQSEYVLVSPKDYNNYYDTYLKSYVAQKKLIDGLYVLRLRA